MSAAQPAIETQVSAANVDLQAPPTHEAIQIRAYQLWQTRLRHGNEGSADQDWLSAEHELSNETASYSAKHEPEESDI